MNEYNWKVGDFLEVIVYAFITILLLIPILYFVPLGFNFKGKLIIAGLSFLLAVIGLYSNKLYPLWQTVIMLLLLAAIITYFIEKKLRVMTSANVKTEEVEENSYIGEEKYSTVLDGPKLDVTEKFDKDDQSNGSEELSDKDFNEKENVDSELDTIEIMEDKIEGEEDHLEAQIIKDTGEADLKQQISKEEVEPQEDDHEEIKEITELEEEIELKEEGHERRKYDELKEEYKLPDDEQETNDIDEIEEDIDDDPSEEQLTSDEKNAVEELLQDREALFAQLESNDGDASAEEESTDLFSKGESFLDSIDTFEEDENSKSNLDTNFNDTARHVNDEFNDIEIQAVEGNDVLDSQTEKIDDQDQLDDEGAWNKDIIIDSELIDEDDDVIPEIDFSGMDKVADSINLVDEIGSESDLYEKEDGEASDPVTMNQGDDDILLDGSHDYTEVIEKIDDTEDTLSNESAEGSIYDSDEKDTINAEDVENYHQEVAPYTDLATPTKTKIQQQMFHTMISHLHVMRNTMSSEDYEQMIKEHLHPSLPDQDYYTFAHLLIEHYIQEKKYEKLLTLLEELKDGLSGYPILQQEILFLLEQYKS